MQNLTFIFQGPYYEGITEECISNVKKNFPGSRLIFSTWTGQQIPLDLADRIIFSLDPGGEINSIWNTSDSTLRQFFSTYNGLLEVSTDYCCKIRSDTLLESGRLTELINYLHSNNLNKIVMLNYLSVNPRRFPLTFHFCDWIVAGRSTELRKIYQHAGQATEGINHFVGVTVDRCQYGWYCKHRSEQYIALNWIKNLKKSILLPRFQTDIDKDIIASHNNFIRKHVLLVPGWAIGVRNMKRLNDLTLNTGDGLFSPNYYDWECDESLNILRLSIGKELIRCFYYSIKRMVLTPAYVMRFMLHIMRYKSGVGWRNN
jgi:hypothetical protein